MRVLWRRELDQALNDCNRALEALPSDGNTLNSRAAVEFLLNDFETSARDYDAAYRAEPRIVGSLYGRGVARVRLGQGDAGQADIAEALSRDPSVAARYADYGISP